MPAEDLPFAATLESGNDELAGAVPVSTNLLVDGRSVARTRPGISVWADFPTTIPNASPVDGIWVWNGYLVYQTRDRKLWALTSPGNVIPLSSAVATTQVDGATRPVAVSTKSRIVIAGGGAMQKWEGTGLSARLLGLNLPAPLTLATTPLPPATTHVTEVATRLVANARDISGLISWSYTNESPGHETWDPINFIEAAARPDRSQGIYDNANEVFVFGETTLEVFRPDANLGFAPGRALNIGTLSPYSPVRDDEAFVFLDNQKRFQVTNGRSYQDATAPVQKTIDAFGTISDCWSAKLKVDQFSVLMWQFPTEGRTFCWQKDSNRWTEFTGYAGGVSTAFAPTAFCRWQERDVSLVGLSTGQIAKLDKDATTDLGNPIRVEALTGFVDHGTSARKASTVARFTFRKVGSGAPTVAISWRDDQGPFGQPVNLALDAATDLQPTLEIRSAGVYRQRQWKIEMTDAGPLSLIRAREEYVVLEG